MVTLERLMEIVSYDPETGIFTYLQSRGPRSKGSAMGHIAEDGYIVTRIDGRKYPVHRLAWMYVHGMYPSMMIDHIDGNRSNNRIANLRLATSSDNQKNSKRRSTNKSGCTGVYWNKERKSWMAYIKSHGKLMKLGYFEDIDAAIAARKSAEPLFGFHPNHGRHS